MIIPLKFVNIINDAKGYQIGARHITISTCGLIPKIKQFAELKTQVNLAISLHAPNNTIRNQLMPINKVYPVEKLMNAVRYYIRLLAILTKIKKLQIKKIKLNLKISIFKNFNCFLSINNQVSQEVWWIN